MIPVRDILPTYSPPYATRVILWINVAVFALQIQDLEGSIRTFGAYPFQFTGLEPQVSERLAELLGGGASPPAADAFPWWWLRGLTHMWLHGDLLHLIGNMWFLWIFGDNVEDRLGPFRYVLLYVLGGAIALAAQVVAAPDSAVPMVGASGAIAAALGAYLLFYPEAKVVTLVPLGFLPLFFLWPAKVVLGLWIGFQVLLGLASLETQGETGGVAWWAHIGGFALGYVLAGPMAGGDAGPPKTPDAEWEAWRTAGRGRRMPPRRIEWRVDRPG